MKDIIKSVILVMLRVQKIKVLDLDTNISKTYLSMTDLAKELGVSTSAINYYLKNPSSLKNKKIETV
jgi:predicted transcriptional regulator